MTEDPNVYHALPVGVAAAQVPAAEAEIETLRREVEALRADARRLEFWFSNDAKSVDMAGYLRGVREGWSLNRWREFIDAGMAANKPAATPEARQNGNKERTE